MTSRRYAARLGIIPALPRPFTVIAKDGILSFIPRYGRKSDVLSVELSEILRQLKEPGQYILPFNRKP